MRLETLEKRELLAADVANALSSDLADEYDEIRALFPELNLPQTTDSINVARLDASNLSVENFQKAVSVAGKTTVDDLIILQTTDAAHTLTFANATDEFEIAIDSAKYGSLTVVAFGTQPLTIDASRTTRIATISASDVRFANTTFKSGLDEGAVASASGGAFYVEDSNVSFVDCAFEIDDSKLGAATNALNQYYFAGQNLEAACKVGFAGLQADGTRADLFSDFVTSETIRTTELRQDSNAGDHYGCLWTGYFTPSYSGEYGFYSNTLKAGAIWLDVDQNGVFTAEERLAYSNASTSSSNVSLVAGRSYAVAFATAETYGDDNYRFMIAPPGWKQTFILGEGYQGGTWSADALAKGEAIYAKNSVVDLIACSVDDRLVKIDGALSQYYFANQNLKSANRNGFAGLCADGTRADIFEAFTVDSETIRRTPLRQDSDVGEYYGCLWTGYFTPSQTGEYGFYSQTDDVGTFWIDLNEDGFFDSNEKILETNCTKQSATIDLVSGKSYAVAFSFDEGVGSDYFHFQITPPNGEQAYVLSDEDQGGTWSAVERFTSSNAVYVENGALNLTDVVYSGKPFILDAKSTSSSTYVVTTIEDVVADDGKISLREAIKYAESGATITFAESLGDATIRLNAQLCVNKELTIDGSGRVVLDGQNASRLIYNDATLTLRGLTLTNGQADVGAAIYSSDALNVYDCVFTNNVATDQSDYVSGAAIAAFGASLIVDESTFEGNDGVRDGALGINRITATVSNSIFRDNSSNEGAGAIIVEYGTATISDCLISNNASLGYAALYVVGETKVVDCIVSGNVNSGTYGGGVCYYSGSTEISHCTIVGNKSSYGSGIYRRDGALTINDSIVALNYATETTPGIYGEYFGENNYVDYNPIFVEDPYFDTSGNLTNAGSLDLNLAATSPLASRGDDYVGAYKFEGTATLCDYSVVTTTDDEFDLSNDAVSLREAIWLATEEHKTITFAESLGETTIYFDSQIVVDKEITILGEGRVTLDGQEKTRFFTNRSTLTLNGLTLTTGYGDYGAAIYNVGAASLNVVDCEFLYNASITNGGAIYNRDQAGTVEIKNSVFDSNTSGSNGGAIDVRYGTLTIVASEFYGNTAVGSGGAIETGGTAKIERSFFIGNVARRAGAVYSNSNATVEISNSAFSENEASERGGALYNERNLTLTNVTVAGNKANDGGGIYQAQGTLTLQNSIVSQNYAVSNVNIRGAINAGGNNVVEVAPGFVQAPIWKNGTLTNGRRDPIDLRLTASSFAKNRGYAGYVAEGAVDLEGSARIVAGRVDVGAYELQDATESSFTYVVNTIDDVLDCNLEQTSLREALEFAIDGDVIAFDASLKGATVALNSSLVVEKRVLIDGAELGIVIDGGAKTRLFYNTGDLTLKGLTLQNGTAPRNNQGGAIYNLGAIRLEDCRLSTNVTNVDGGAVFNEGTLSVVRCEFSGNKSTERVGGAIYNAASLMIVDSSFAENSAPNSSGGAVYNDGEDAFCSISNSIFSENSSRYGGAVANYRGELAVSESNFTENVASGASNSSGGAIHSNYGTQTINASQFIGNASASSGGALWIASDSTITNSYFAQNVSASGGAVTTNRSDARKLFVGDVFVANSATDAGGALRVENGAQTTLTNCTISGNVAKNGGGFQRESGTLKIYDSIVYGNYASQNLEYAGAISVDSHSLVGVDPKFVQAPVFVDGVLTNADEIDLSLDADSPAIDAAYGICAIDEPAAQTLFDATGNSRKVASYGVPRVDVGAYEYQSAIKSENEARSLVVTTLEDVVDATDGLISLREAISYAGDDATITFADSLGNASVKLESQLSVDKRIVIDGADQIAFDGQNKTRLIYNVATLTLRGLTLTNGSADDGGAIYNVSGATTSLVDVEFSYNVATRYGGAIYNLGTLSVEGAIFDSNRATSHGGAIYSNGTARVVESEFYENESDADGGAVAFWGTGVFGADLFQGNVATYGGAIYSNADANSKITDSAFWENEAARQGGAYYLDGKISLINVTVAGNKAQTGGGIYDAGTLALQNSIVSQNYAETSTNVYGTIDVDTNNIINLNPGFVQEPIWKNGILTNKTRAPIDLNLTVRSWAIDSGNLDFVATETDASGAARIFGVGVDIGAYEFQESVASRDSISTVVDVADDSFDAKDGKTSLREAIFNAKDGAVITFAPALNGKTIALQTLELRFDRSVAIDASALSDVVVIDAGGTSRVANVAPNDSNAKVRFNNLTISGGKAENGGGVYVPRGTFEATNCVVTGNSATNGGGFYFGASARATLNEVVVSFNQATSYGAGIYAYGDASEQIFATNCAIFGNAASGAYGGGFYVEGGAILAVNCTIAGNSARTSGGGVALLGGKRSCLSTFNCIVADNYGGDFGSVVSLRSESSLLETSPSFVVAPQFDENGVLTNAETIDLRLNADSWAIDSGVALEKSGVVDVEEKARRVGSAIDLGAYEFVGTTKQADRRLNATVVTTLDDSFNADDGKISLREAIFWAKDGATITFAPNLTGTVRLRSTLNVASDVAVNGGGKITLDGGNTARLIAVFGGALELTGLSFANGRADYGGAIFVCADASVAINDSKFVTNKATSTGGAIYNEGTLTVSGTEFLENEGIGGAINNEGGVATIDRCRFVGNKAVSDGGGAIRSINSRGLSVYSSLFAKNYSASYGGAIITYDWFVAVNNTFVDNSARSGGAISGYATLYILLAFENFLIMPLAR